MACSCSRVGSRGEVLLMNSSSREKRVGGALTEEEKDVLWNVAVPGGCRWASDLTDSEAGASMFVFQTLKNENERMAAPDVE